MIITKDLVDQLCSEHGRTSCNDLNLANAYGGWYGRYNPTDGKKVIRLPRCTRCYLMSNLGMDTNNLEFRPIQDTYLVYQG